MPARLSLKDQLVQLSQPGLVDLDPEDVFAGNDAPEHRWSIDHSAARQHYIDVAPSTLRELHESVNDSKYDGATTSRRQLLQDDDTELQEASEDEDGQELACEEDSENTSEGGVGGEGSCSLHEAGHSQDEFGSGSEDGTTQSHTAAHRKDVTSSSPSRIDAAGLAPLEGNVASNLRITYEADKRKGKAVSRQIVLWNTLLDARIQLQKAVIAANRLPPPRTHNPNQPDQSVQYASHPAARGALETLRDVTGSLAEELLTLQGDLLNLNETIKVPPRKRQRLDLVSDPDPIGPYGAMMQELSVSASALEIACHPWLVDTLSKWSAKVQAAAPNVLPDNRNSFMRGGKLSQIGVVSLIDNVLRLDGTKLLDRTQKRKDKHTPIGRGLPALIDDGQAVGEDQATVNIFDDTDYYQQLLRDVIAGRGGSDGQGGEAQWLIQQRERKAKRRKAVDTKASKGRKLRYEVHPKLQNFMVPVPVVGGEWHEEQIDGLFSSLLQM